MGNANIVGVVVLAGLILFPGCVSFGSLTGFKATPEFKNFISVLERSRVSHAVLSCEVDSDCIEMFRDQFDPPKIIEINIPITDPSLLRRIKTAVVDESVPLFFRKFVIIDEGKEEAIESCCGEFAYLTLFYEDGKKLMVGITMAGFFPYIENVSPIEKTAFFSESLIRVIVDSMVRFDREILHTEQIEREARLNLIRALYNMLLHNLHLSRYCFQHSQWTKTYHSPKGKSECLINDNNKSGRLRRRFSS